MAIDTEKKAVIFNIQKFSIHDGPGIRTVVFFKGCPLKCIWCSNPESQKTEPEILWDSQKCTGCQKCVALCKALTYSNNAVIYNRKECKACGQCIRQCTNRALTLEGEYKTVEDVVKEVLKDKDFYDESGGGVTFSGGEVLLQHQFASDLAIQLHTHNIHVACETTGFGTQKVFQDFIQHMDLLLFDIKHYDNELHYKYTGVPNDRILENLTYAVKMKKQIVARIPVIPGINDKAEDANEFCRLFMKIGIKRVDLLPFHQFGQKKYNLLQLDYKMKDTKQLHKEDLISYKEIFDKSGFTCII